MRLKELREKLRAGGLWRRKRPQLIGAEVEFYLMRDLFLYVVLPALVWTQAR